MIICVCKRVNSTQVKKALEQGVTEVSELSEQLGLGTGCGRCVEFTKQMILKEQANLIVSDTAA
jgi:bacterioferritin-associated ferredoxin